MKVIILAAGKGTRMLPLTEEVPKVLVEINGRPFLYYLMTKLKRAGYTDFGIVVGYKKEKIPQFLKEYNFQAEIIEQDEQHGTGHAVLQAEQYVNGEDFIVLGGDNLWGVEDLKEMNIDDDYNYISGIIVDSPEHYGVLVEEDGVLKEVKEKPKGFHGFLINTGLYKFKNKIFDLLKNVEHSPRGEIELTCAINHLAKEGKVKINKVKTFWKDLGKIEDIEPLSYFLEEIWKD